MAVKDNWYIALELEFDPVPVEDMAVINKRIDEKVQYWNNHTNDPQNGRLYDSWRQAEARIRADMADAGKRRQMADAARVEKYGPLDKTLNQATGMSTRPLTPEKLKKIAKMRGLSEAVVEKRARDLGIKISEDGPSVSPERYKQILDEHYSSKPPKYALFEGFRANLESAGYQDFYSFLFPEAKERAGLTTEDFYKAAEAKRKENASGKITAEKTLNRDVAADARKAFESEDAKKNYDTYLKYREKRREIDEIISEVNNLHDKKCSRSVTDDYIVRLMSVVVDKSIAAELFVAICELNGFTYDIGDDDSPTMKNLVTCRCGKVNDTGDGRKVCERCGKDLWHTCPQCDKETFATANFCTCGFDYSNIYRVDRLTDLAKAALKNYDLEETRRLISQAKALYSKHKDLPAIESELRSLEGKIGAKVADIDRQVSAKNYKQARVQFDDLRQSFPQYQNPVLLANIDNQLKQAGDKLREAQSKSDRNDILQACKEAYEICRDFPGIQELASKYTDLPLDALSVNDVAAQNVSASVVNNRVAIKLALPNEGETGITIAYRFDKYPSSPVDPMAQIKDFSIRELEREGLLGIEKAQELTYYIAVYLKFSVSGNAYYSPGVYCQLNLAGKVVLTYSLSKKFLSKRIAFTLAPDKSIDRIPRIDIVYNIGNAPVYASSAKHLTTIPEQSISGRFECELDPPSPLARNTYLKPFLGESDVGSFQLKLASNSSNKVS